MLRTCILLLSIIIITYITYYIVIVYRLMFWSRRIVYYYDYRSRSAASLFIFRIIINSHADDFVFCIAGTVYSIRIFNIGTYLILLLLLVYCATYALYYGGALSRATCVSYSRRETQNALRRPIEVRIPIKKNCGRLPPSLSPNSDYTDLSSVFAVFTCRALELLT